MRHTSGSQRILNDLENLYRTLALESKKTDNHIKNSAEKAIRKLREYKNNVEKIDINLKLSNDIILRPLILSWSSKHISISLTALNILQKLLNINCISPDSFMQILISLRTLLTLHTNKYVKDHSSHNYNQSSLDINIQIKMCQILIQIPNSSSWTISRPFLQHLVFITLLLCQSEETAVRSTSLAALQQIATVSLEYCVNAKSGKHSKSQSPKNNNVNQPHIRISESNEPMYIFESLFHDLCCLASPKLSYLEKSNIVQPKDSESNHNSSNNKDPNNTSVTFSAFPIHPNMDNEDIKVKDNEIVSNNVMNDNDPYSLSVELESPSISNNAHLITHLYDNLSTLRLLDCDFAIDNVPILELLETLIANETFYDALKQSNGLLHILHNQLCPLLCSMIESCEKYECMQKIGRLIIELLSRHYRYLEVECDEILSALLRLLEPSNDFPEWAPIIILEILRHLLKNSYLLKYFYIKYDMNTHSDKRVFGSLIHGLGRFLHQTTSNNAKYTIKWSPKRLDNKYFSFIKDPKNPPTNDPALQVSLAVLSLISFVEGLAFVCNVSASPPTSPRSTPPPPPLATIRKSSNYPPEEQQQNNETEDENIVFDEDMSNEHDITLDVSKDIARQMVEVVWRPLLAALSHMLSHSIEESQYQQLLSIYQTTSRICGRIQLIKPLERLLSSMSEHGLPHPFFNYTFSDILFKLSNTNQIFAANNIKSSHGVNDNHLQSNTMSTSQSMQSLDVPASPSTISFMQSVDSNNGNEAVIQLSIKNVCTIHALVNIAHGLGSILGSAWFGLLETFEKLDYIFHRQNIQLVDIDFNVISSDSHWNDEVNMLDSRLQQLFDSSEYLDDNSLRELLAALGHLSSTSLAGLATTLDKGPSTATASNNAINKNKSKNVFSDDAISVDKVQSFALRKFVQTIEVNIYRLDKIWDHVIAHLHVIMNFKNSTLRHFGIKTLIRIQLKVLTDPGKDHRNKKKPRSEREYPHKTKDKDLSDIISAQIGKKKEVKKVEEKEEDFQERLFSPYVKLLKSKYPDTRERVIRAVSELLESAGEYISTGWPKIVELLNYVPSTENNSVNLSCLKLAFDDVRLIASDFLDCLPDFCILGLIKTVGLFGKQTKDNNISYSSIGLLWKISDYITLITNNNNKDNEEDKSKSALINIADGLQIAIFKQLQVLCVDGRSDVRNCAMQTINSALVAYGDRLKLSSWIECVHILKVLLTDVVVKRTRLNQQQDAQKREELTKREYRAFRKKWNETEKHCVRGGSRICKMFIVKLHKADDFRNYWSYYLQTIIKLLDLNPEVASVGITCLQEIAQSSDFIYCCSQDGRYWTEIINCYETMIRNVGHKEYEIISSRKQHLLSSSSERYDQSNYTEQLSLPFADVCDVMMESIKDLLNPTMASRKLFLLSQIEKLINNLDFLISDKNLTNTLKTQPLEILDARLIRLKKLLAIYEQLPPLAPSIAKPIISKIASYLLYVSKCCHCYHHYASKMNAKSSGNASPVPNRNDGTPNTVKKLTKLSFSEKSLLKKTEKTMDYVSGRAITLLNQFYSIHIPHELKVECFEIVINGISKIMDPFICPISVVSNAIKGFEEVCKTGLPQFSAAHCRRSVQQNDEQKVEKYRLSNVESLRVWSVLGDVVSIAFRLQHHINPTHTNKQKMAQQNSNNGNIKQQQNENKTLQQLVELKLSILETTMTHILPFGHLAPQTLKKRIVLLLNGNCWSDSTHSTASIQRHARLGQACITAMFELCSDTLKSEKEQRFDEELSAMSYQLLIPKIAFILDQYIDDEMSKQNRVLPRYRQKHIVHVLNQLNKLQIDPNLDGMDSYFDIKSNQSNKVEHNLHHSELYCSGPLLLLKGRKNKRPHLFRLYPVLCKLIRVKDEEIKNCLCDVFKTFGDEMGLK